MRTKRHRMLLNLLYQEFEDIAVDYHEVNVPRSKANLHLLDGPRMKDIWESGRRLIICYPEDSAATGFVFPFDIQFILMFYFIAIIFFYSEQFDLASLETNVG